MGLFEDQYFQNAFTVKLKIKLVLKYDSQPANDDTGIKHSKWIQESIPHSRILATTPDLQESKIQVDSRIQLQHSHFIIKMGDIMMGFFQNSLQEFTY